MSTEVKFLGLNLKNPVIVASGPWSRDAETIQRSIDAGAGAVVTETIMLEPRATISPRFFYNEGKVYNTTLYSTIDLEQWEQEIEQINKKGSYLICSIWGSSPSEMAYIATKVQRMGADAIEMSISAPIGTKNKSLSYHSDSMNEFVKSVVDAVDIPVMVKLSYDAGTNLEFVRSIELAGATAISAIDSLKSIQGVDIEKQKTQMRTYGGYSGEHIRPVSLATTASLAQFTSCEICGVGGINTHENVLEYIMLGAKTIQLATAVMLEGYEVITEVINNLDKWLDSHNVNDIDTLRGKALRGLTPFEDIEPEPYVSSLQKPCPDNDCDICIKSCMYRAISRQNDKIETDHKLCTGCGLCIDRCPSKCFELGWK